MQNSLWKLTSLAGVIGVTCLIIVILREEPKSSKPGAPPPDTGLQSELPEMTDQDLEGLASATPLSQDDDWLAANDEPNAGAPPFEPSDMVDDNQPPPFEPTAASGLDFNEPERNEPQPSAADPSEFQPFEDTGAAVTAEATPIAADDSAADPDAQSPFFEESATDTQAEPESPPVTEAVPLDNDTIELFAVDQVEADPTPAPADLPDTERHPLESEQGPLLTAPGSNPQQGRVQLTAGTEDEGGASVEFFPSEEGPLDAEENPFAPEPNPFAAEDDRPAEPAPAATAPDDESDTPFVEELFGGGPAAGQSDEAQFGSELDNNPFPDDSPQPSSEAAAEIPEIGFETGDPQPAPTPEPAGIGDSVPLPTSEFPELGVEFPGSTPAPAETIESASEPLPETFPNTERAPVDPAPWPERAAEPEETLPLFPGPGPADTAAETPPPRFGEEAIQPDEKSYRGTGVVDRTASDRVRRPELKVAKVAPDTAVLGHPFIYHIDITNAGNTVAEQVRVEDRIPKGTELSGTIPRAELIDGVLVWKLGPLQPEATTRISVKVIPYEEGQLGSVTRVTSTAEVAARTMITSPQLQVSMSAPAEARVGQPIIFRFQVTNKGEGTANKVILRNVLPVGLSHDLGRDLEYEVGRLAAGESQSVQLTLRATRPGLIVNKATVTAAGHAPVSAQARVDIRDHALQLTRVGPQQRLVNRPAVFINRVTNESDTAVRNTVIVESVPNGMQFVEASHGGRFRPDTRTVTWRIDALAPRDKLEVTVKLAPQSPGTLDSVVEVIDESGSKRKARSTLKVTEFALVGVDVSEVDRPVAVGEQMLLTVRARNRGPSAAEPVELTFQVPPQLELLSIRRDGNALPLKQTAAGTYTLAQLPELGGRMHVDYELLLEAVDAGDARLQFQISAAGMSEPLTRDELILIFRDGER